MPLDTNHVNALLSVVHQTVQLPKLSGLRDLAMAELEHLHKAAQEELAEIAQAFRAKQDKLDQAARLMQEKIVADEKAKNDAAQAAADEAAKQKPLPFAERQVIEPGNEDMERRAV